MSPPPAVRPRARLWLVRHAQPVVAAGTCYGALDVPADAAATQVAAQRLAQALPAGAAAHYSTLQRCELLALATQALQPNLTIHPDARLRELAVDNIMRYGAVRALSESLRETSATVGALGEEEVAEAARSVAHAEALLEPPLPTPNLL
mgnify:CR=1 FL=1